MNRDEAISIGWGIAARSKDGTYTLVETKATRTEARRRTNERNRTAQVGTRYRTVRLSASHP